MFWPNLVRKCKDQKAYLEDDLAAAHVLVLDELNGVVPLLVGRLAEKLGEAGQGLVLAVEEGAHGQVDVAGVHLHVDLLVDGSLVVLVKVLTDDGHLVVRCFSKVGEVNSNLVLVSVIALIESSRKHSGCRESDVN